MDTEIAKKVPVGAGAHRDTKLRRFLTLTPVDFRGIPETSHLCRRFARSRASRHCRPDAPPHSAGAETGCTRGESRRQERWYWKLLVRRAHRRTSSPFATYHLSPHDDPDECRTARVRE